MTGATNGWYALGGSVTVTAVPDAHYHFAGWTGDVPGDTNALAMTVTLDQARTVTANFALDQHTLTVVSAHGTAIRRPGRTRYDYGTALTNSGEQSRDGGRDAVRVHRLGAWRATSRQAGEQRADDDADERRDADVAVGDELPVHGHGAARNGSVTRLDERVVRAGRERDGDGGAGRALPLRGVDGRRAGRHERTRR